MSSSLEKLCIEKGLKMTDQRRVIAKALSDASDHPDVETLHRRVNKLDERISVATVYRTLRLFEDVGIIEKHDFGDGRARYEEKSDDHHDHLMNVETGEVIEFFDEELEVLKEKIAQKYHLKLVDHRLELYGVPLKKSGHP